MTHSDHDHCRGIEEYFNLCAPSDCEIDKRFLGYFDVKSFDKANTIIDEILSIKNSKDASTRSAKKRIKSLKDEYFNLEVYSIR